MTSVAASAVYLLNLRGDTLISRNFRDAVDRNVVDGFRTQIIQKKIVATKPVHQVGNCSFLHVKNENVYAVLVCQTNANAILGFKFLHEMIKLFKSYFGGSFNVDSVKNNFVLIYELLDEIMDNGVPQILTPNILKQYVMQQGTQVLKLQGPSDTLEKVRFFLLSSFRW